MVTYSTDTAAVMRLGGDIVAMAGDIDEAAIKGAGAPDVGDPPNTSAALASFVKAYGQSTSRLHDDVVALGRLTQAVGAEYDAVEIAAARLNFGDG